VEYIKNIVVKFLESNDHTVPTPPLQRGKATTIQGNNLKGIADCNAFHLKFHLKANATIWP